MSRAGKKKGLSAQARQSLRERRRAKLEKRTGSAAGRGAGRADKTVADWIAKALRDEGRDQPAAPRLPAPKFLVPNGDYEEA